MDAPKTVNLVHVQIQTGLETVLMAPWRKAFIVIVTHLHVIRYVGLADASGKRSESLDFGESQKRWALNEGTMRLSLWEIKRVPIPIMVYFPFLLCEGSALLVNPDLSKVIDKTGYLYYWDHASSTHCVSLGELWSLSLKIQLFQCIISPLRWYADLRLIKVF